MSVVKNTVTLAQKPFIAKLSYFVHKLLATSQIFVVAAFPLIFFEFRKKIGFRQVFAVDNEENTWFGKLSTTTFAVDRFGEMKKFLKVKTIRHTRDIKCKGFIMVACKVLRFTFDFYIARKCH